MLGCDLRVERAHLWVCRRRVRAAVHPRNQCATVVKTQSTCASGLSCVPQPESRWPAACPHARAVWRVSFSTTDALGKGTRTMSPLCPAPFPRRGFESLCRRAELGFLSVHVLVDVWVASFRLLGIKLLWAAVSRALGGFPPVSRRLQAGCEAWCEAARAPRKEAGRSRREPSASGPPGNPELPSTVFPRVSHNIYF